MAWRIDRDYLDGDQAGRASVNDFSPSMPRFRFRLRDDDGEVYYGGEFDRTHDDDNVNWESSPYGCLKWAESFAGATDFQMHAKDAIKAGMTSAKYLQSIGAKADDWISIYG